MGRDKALIQIGGLPLAVRVAAALAAAGATDVRAVGGDAAALAAHGLLSVPDRWPGEGPLGGIVTALTSLAAPAAPGAEGGEDGGADAGPAGDGPGIVVVAACDLVAPSPATLAATVAALAGAPDAGVAVPTLAGRRRWDQAAWETGAAGPLEAAFAAGERAVHRAVTAAGLAVVEVPGLDPASLADADTPADLRTPGDTA